MNSDKDHTERACISCENIYTGALKCPKCGEPGEPLEVTP